MYWITSDTHFGHKGILSFCPKTRPYADVDEMNEAMIRDWNRKVAPDDTVYHLGDVAFMPWEKAVQLLNRLNGKKILIKGNHDRKLLKRPQFVACFAEIHDYLRISYEKKQLIMFHYPIAEWDMCYRGAVHFHGHLHGNPSGLEAYKTLDVGVDATGRIVLSLEEAIAHADTGIIKPYHDKVEL